MAASLWRPDDALGGVRPSPVLLSARLISVSMDSSCSLATLGVDAAGWSGLESGGDRGDRMGEPPGTLPLDEDEALRVTTSFHEFATDSLVARCCWSLGDPLLSLFLSNRFSNMGCTSPHGDSSSACASSPPVRLRSAASASKMRRTSSSSAVAPPDAAAAGCGCPCALLTLLEGPTALLPFPLLFPPAVAPPLAPLPSAQTVEEKATLEPGFKPSCGVTVLVIGGLGACGGGAWAAAGATRLAPVPPAGAPAAGALGPGGGSAFSRERAASSSQGRAALRLAPAAAAVAPSSHSALRFLLVS